MTSEPVSNRAGHSFLPILSSTKKVFPAVQTAGTSGPYPLVA